jgi:hypothetical protein
MAESDSKTRFNPDYVARSVTVVIDAPASVVWDVLVDLPKYGEWNPFCVKCESTLEMGAPVVMTIASPWDPSEQNVVTEFLCAYEPEKLLAWQMPWSEVWPYAGRRDQVIDKLGPEQCSYYSTDAFLGDSAIHIVRFGMSWISAGFTATAHALKTRAEAVYAEQRQKVAVNA